MAGVRFLKHNIRDDFDDLTDVARLYGIRAVPCFLFFIGGAQVMIPRRASVTKYKEHGLLCCRAKSWDEGSCTHDPGEGCHSS